MGTVVLFAILFLAGMAVLRGRTPDTRDTDFSLGPVIAPHAAPDVESR
jgi:hypothetical protein